MKLSKESFGRLPDGRGAYLYILENSAGMRAEITNYGGILKSLWIPGRDSALADIVLGYDTLEEYLAGTCYFGAVIGRNANRISGASYRLGDKIRKMEANDGPNNLHSGGLCYSRRLFTVFTGQEGGRAWIELSLEDPGSEEFPGDARVKIIYSLNEDGCLEIEYKGICQEASIFNLTNHSYFNLAGHSSGAVLGQYLQLEAGFYTPNSRSCLPNGAVLPAEGAYDFSIAKPLGKDLTGDEQLRWFGGYDHNYALKGRGYRRAALAWDPESGRRLSLWTDCQGVQLYTGNAIKGEIGKSGTAYEAHQGFCLETQHFPDAVNVSHFPSPIVEAGREYRSKTSFCFDITKNME